MKQKFFGSGRDFTWRPTAGLQLCQVHQLLHVAQPQLIQPRELGIAQSHLGQPVQPQLPPFPRGQKLFGETRLLVADFPRFLRLQDEQFFKLVRHLIAVGATNTILKKGLGVVLTFTKV